MQMQRGKRTCALLFAGHLITSFRSFDWQRASRLIDGAQAA
jgi:hypothetical protein